MPKYDETSLQWLSWTWKRNKKKVGVTKVKKKKKKLLSRQWCIRALDKYFSRFIRYRDADERGIISCVSCGDLVPWKKAHNCHYIDRAKRWYRWDEKNCHAGCVSCNTYRQQFHMRHYTIFMFEKYWLTLLQEMLGNEKKIQKVSTPDIREKLEHYKSKCKELGLW